MSTGDVRDALSALLGKERSEPVTPSVISGLKAQ
jgi:hypothetical protein